MNIELTKLTVAIDGPSGAGKSTVAKLAAAASGLVYVDTGALYRTVGLYMLEHGIGDEDEEGIVAALPRVDIRLAFENGVQQVYLCGEAVGDMLLILGADKGGIRQFRAGKHFLRGFKTALRGDMESFGSFLTAAWDRLGDRGDDGAVMQGFADGLGIGGAAAGTQAGNGDTDGIFHGGTSCSGKDPARESRGSFLRSL